MADVREGASEAPVRRGVARGVVWSGFFVTLTSVAAYVAWFGSYYPHEDDWQTVHFVTGHWPMTLEWLWSPHNEHRMFLPRLVWWGLATVFGPDPRVVLWTNVLLLAGTTALFLGVAGRLRGRWSYGDLVIPLALLNLSQYRNLLWATQLMWFLPVAFFALAVRVMVVRSGIGACLVVALLASLMILCGGPGMLLAAPLIGWVLLRGVILWRSASPSRRLRGGAALGGGVLALAVLGLYLFGLERRVEDAPVTWRLILQGCVEFFAIGVDATATFAVCGVGLVVLVVFGVALASVVAGIAPARPLALTTELPAASLPTTPTSTHRSTALALLVALGSVGLMALVMSYGRGPRVAGSCALPRYVLAASLAPVVLQLVGAWWRRVWLGAVAISAVLIGVLLVQLPGNVGAALGWGRQTAAAFAALDRDIAARVPAMTLARRHYPTLCDVPDQYRRVFFFLVLMNHGRWRPFVGEVSLNFEKEGLIERRLPVRPIQLAGTTWDGRRGQTSGPDPQLWFELEEPMAVAGVRLELAVQPPHNRRAKVEVRTARAGINPPLHWSPGVSMWRSGSPTPEVVDVPLDGAVIDRLRIDPASRECAFELAEITLLVLPETLTAPK